MSSGESGGRRYCGHCESWHGPDVEVCENCGASLVVGKWDRRLIAVDVPLGLWCVLCHLSFYLAVVIHFLGAPPWLPLPWSTFEDFVEGIDGRVYVDLPIFSQVLCYDDSGRFVASYRHPQLTNGPRLAAGDNGLVYFRGHDTVFGMTNSWDAARKVVVEHARGGIWRMGAEGEPVFHPGSDLKIRAPDRALSPGEPLFTASPYRWRRRTFLCVDGSMLRRKGNSLEKVSQDGTVLTRYGSHWLYAPFVFPWPGALGMGLPLLYFGVRRQLRRKWSRPGAHRRRKGRRRLQGPR